MKTHIEIYQDKQGKYRWRVTHDNSNIIGSSSQGYVRREDCIQNMAALGFALRPVTDEKGRGQ